MYEEGIMVSAPISKTIFSVYGNDAANEKPWVMAKAHQ